MKKWLMFIVLLGLIVYFYTNKPISISSLKENDSEEQVHKNNNQVSDRHNDTSGPEASDANITTKLAKTSNQQKNETTKDKKKWLKNTSDQVLLDVPFISQLPELQRGCEVTSLAMMLQYAGVEVGKMELAERIKKVPYRTSTGKRGNPNEGFVGDIYTFSKDGYAVYHAPIVDLGEKYLPKRMIDLTERPFQAILDQIKQGYPVLLITNGSFRPLPKSEFRQWQTDAGPVKMTWREHTVLITGYDEDHLYINNPLNGKNDKIDKQLLIESWKQLGQQAVSYR